MPGLVEKRIFDTLTGAQAASQSVWTLLAFVTAEIARLARYVVYLSDFSFQESLRNLLQFNLLTVVLQQPGAMPLPISTGEALSRFGDDVAEVKDFPLWLPDMFGKFLCRGGAGHYGAHQLDHDADRGDSGLSGFVDRPGGLGASAGGEASARARDGVQGFLGEILAVQVVKVTDSEEHVIGHFHGINEARRKAQVDERLYHSSLSRHQRTGDAAWIGLILLLAGLGIRNGTFSVGDFALFMYYIWFITWFFRDCGSLWVTIRPRPFLVRLEELAQTGVRQALLPDRTMYLDVAPPPISPPLKQAADTLQMLTARSDLLPSIIRSRIEHVNLEVPRAALWSLRAAGAGKVRCCVLLGLLPKDAGQICWNGEPIGDPADFFKPLRQPNATDAAAL
ncbi:MAG: ABC transporter ATP-binding protein [Caldilineaceae bacterium]|nr:ABC transporter ATP-binding protein [Caldilineaceae bacterium]